MRCFSFNGAYKRHLVIKNLEVESIIILLTDRKGTEANIKESWAPMNDTNQCSISLKRPITSNPINQTPCVREKRQKVMMMGRREKNKNNESKHNG